MDSKSFSTLAPNSVINLPAPKLSNSTNQINLATEHICRGFDWNSEIWDRVASEINLLVQKASTNWDNRPCVPHDDAKHIRNVFQQPLPVKAVEFNTLLGHLHKVVDYSGYNGHPRWLAYITSSPDPVGVLGAFFTAAINQNNNLWRIAPGATSIELQCIEWFKEMFDLGADWEGIFSSGGQLANIIACATARHLQCPWDVRRHGVAGPEGSGRLKFYTSDQAHYCHHQAVELLGMGSEAIRVVPSDSFYRMRLDRLAEMVAEDRAQGHIPVAVIATAGTVGTGAIDPLDDLVEWIQNQDEKIWLHIDGAYGLPAYLVPEVSFQMAAMRHADSISFDPHKWLYSPLDAGVTLVRHPHALRQTFGFQVSYLDQNLLDTCGVDLVDFTPENSRPARAFKVWLGLMAHGIEGFRTQIGQDIRLIKYMAKLIETTPDLVLMTEPDLSIVCWRVEPQGYQGNEEDLNHLQVHILEELEKQNIAFLSKAKLHGGKLALRACVVNFRTQATDIEATVQASADIGRQAAQA
ncbi:hypothetical protein IXB28_07295 [Leptothoe kymatousa TAU-MAC 1615]|uniref:Uncharacterized protein n=2 Tax=Leptothoe TaxID=2651725 RepID=A0ABS5Y2F0_9CYAN|nr:hypothetical protein [Leptothoe kymatousa TAU-MAC 1615]